MDILCSVFANSKAVRYTIDSVEEFSPKVHVLTLPDVSNHNDRILTGLTLALDKLSGRLPSDENNTVLIQVQSGTVLHWLNSLEAPADRQAALDKLVESWNRVNAKFHLVWVKSPLAKKNRLEVFNVEESEKLSPLVSMLAGMAEE